MHWCLKSWQRQWKGCMKWKCFSFKLISREKTVLKVPELSADSWFYLLKSCIELSTALVALILQIAMQCVLHILGMIWLFSLGFFLKLLLVKTWQDHFILFIFVLPNSFKVKMHWKWGQVFLKFGGSYPTAKLYRFRIVAPALSAVICWIKTGTNQVGVLSGVPLNIN